MPLPEAYRSLPRPSSPRDAKASVVRPYTLGRRSKPSSISLRCNSSYPDYAVVKDQPLRRGEIPFCAEKPPSRLVGVPGIEPGTSSLSGTRSNQLSYTPALCLARGPLPCDGGGSRVRTGDIQLAKLALYQLSHAPGGRLSRRALKRLCSGRLSRSGRDAEDIQLAPAGLMREASPLSPPARGVSPSPGRCRRAAP